MHKTSGSRSESSQLRVPPSRAVDMIYTSLLPVKELRLLQFFLSFHSPWYLLSGLQLKLAPLQIEQRASMGKKLSPITTTPKDITFRLLEQITDGFSEEHKVGSGGFGEVYKGVHNGEQIAVKKLHQMPGLNDEQFKNEFNNLMRVHHKNIVRLVGYCYEVRHTHVPEGGEFVFARIEKRALCFEYMQGGSLDQRLSDESSELDWSTCYKIIKGTCEGLHHLHTGTKDSIYHLDLKPANILLEKDMTPKIGDFGLSRLFASTETYTTKRFIGTLGYMPPEFIEKRQITPKFDVFSLGVIIIQIMKGPKGYSECADMSSQEFIKLVHEYWGEKLQAMSWQTSLEIKTCIEIALRCVEANRVKRPTITEIVEELKRIDYAKKSPIGQSSVSEVCAAVDPLELRFLFEPNKEVSCVLQITNRTDDTIAFRTKTNLKKYHARPSEGVVPPWSKRYIAVTMRAQEEGAAPPADAQYCGDVFIVQSTRVRDDDLITFTGDNDDIAQHFGKLMMGGEEVAVVDEQKLPIVYVALPHPSH